MFPIVIPIPGKGVEVEKEVVTHNDSKCTRCTHDVNKIVASFSVEHNYGKQCLLSPINLIEFGKDKIIKLLGE